MATPTLLESLEAGALGALITVSNSNQAALETWIASGEADVNAWLTALIKRVPAVTGALAFVAAPLEAAFESAIEAYVTSVLAKETPAAIFALYIEALTKLQASV